MKIPNEREFQQIAINHSSDIGSKDFYKSLQKYFTTKLYYFLVNHITLPSDNPLGFRHKLLERI